MKKLLFSGVISFIAIVTLLANSKNVPTNNPIADFYNTSEGYPGWTDEIRWNNVIVMVNKNDGALNYADFKVQRDALYAQGGGVLYYPAGIWNFDIPDGHADEGLMLKKGVVIRGEKPTDPAAITGVPIQSMTSTDHGLNNLNTKFVFSTITKDGGQVAKAWNMIGCKAGTNETDLADVSHIGIAYVEMQYGFIWFGIASNSWSSTWSTGSLKSWAKGAADWVNRVPDGTYPIDLFAGTNGWGTPIAKMGEKRFVFGCNLKNAAVPTYIQNMTNRNLDDNGTEPGSFAFAGKIGVYGRNVFVANNVIAKPTGCFKMTWKTTVNGSGVAKGTLIDLPYDMGYGINIDVNKSLLSGFFNRSMPNDSNGFFATNVVVRDNWFYNHCGKGIDVAGKWMVVKNNVNYRELYDRTDVYGLGDGFVQWGYFNGNGRVNKNNTADDFMSRFIDFGCHNAWFDNNSWDACGSIFDNSGEALLCQRHNGMEIYSAAFTRSKQGNLGHQGYIGSWGVHIVGGFWGWNKTRVANYGALNGGTTNKTYSADISFLQNLNNNGEPKAGKMRVYPDVDIVKDQIEVVCPQANLPTPPTITLTDYNGFVEISWTNSENEAAYRVERKLPTESTWSVLAYRPRQETGGVVTFDTGDINNGFIRVNDNYGPNPKDQFWDGQVRNMNEPKWRDYNNKAEYQYRVVAVGCDDANDGASNTYTTGVEAPSQAVGYVAIKIFPNPVTDYATIEFDSQEKASVNIYDLQGKNVLQLGGGFIKKATFSTSSLNAGVYFVEVIAGNVSTRTKFVVKQ